MGEMADYYIEREMDRWFGEIIFEDLPMAEGYFNDHRITDMDYLYLSNAIGWCNDQGYEDKAKELSAERLRRDFGESACESASSSGIIVLKGAKSWIGCPYCHKRFDLRLLPEDRHQMGFYDVYQCPHCDEWIHEDEVESRETEEGKYLKKIEAYETSDGRIFKNAQEAVAHQEQAELAEGLQEILGQYETHGNITISDVIGCADEIWALLCRIKEKEVLV